jgi:hypothetical protein
VAGASNNGGEDSSGSVITGETSLAHAGSIINDKSSSVFVAHLEIGSGLSEE